MIDFTHDQSDWRWPHVDPVKEWADHASGTILVEPSFLDRFEVLRTLYGKPLPITSGYRTPAHNQQVSTTGEHGPHTLARACDIHVYGADVIVLLQCAWHVGFTGFGLLQKGPVESRILHIDDLKSPDYPRPACWTY